jgi:hypothetical protein
MKKRNEYKAYMSKTCDGCGDTVKRAWKLQGKNIGFYCYRCYIVRTTSMPIITYKRKFIFTKVKIDCKEVN